MHLAVGTFLGDIAAKASKEKRKTKWAANMQELNIYKIPFVRTGEFASLYYISHSILSFVTGVCPNRA